MRAALSRVNARKAAGLEGVPWYILRATYDCTPAHGSNTIVKFADDTTVIGLISNNNESAYREEIQHPTVWCANNNFALNTKRTKELRWTTWGQMIAHTPPSVLTGQRLIVSPASSFWVSTSPRTSLGPSTPPPWSRRLTSVSSSWGD